MPIKSVYVISPVHNREDTLNAFLIGGDPDITPLKEMRDFLEEKWITFKTILVNDASTDETFEIIDDLWHKTIWIKPIHKNKNEMVAKALLDGYTEAIRLAPLEYRYNHPYKKNEVLFVRLDSDLEHNPKHILELIEVVNNGADGAIHQLRYRPEDQTEIDYWFDGSQGTFQGNVILGKGESLLHNCPGYTAYRMDAMEKMLPLYQKYFKLYKEEYGVEPTWGGDMALFFIAKNILRLTIATDLVADSTRQSPGRTIDKVLQQIQRNTAHLLLMRKIQTGKIKFL
ncbi:MAG: glycosyltransferase family 2 protein [bacterium]|nr:glycosyltransferase family 2 protein [bacterium]